MPRRRLGPRRRLELKRTGFASIVNSGDAGPDVFAFGDRKVNTHDPDPQRSASHPLGAGGRGIAGDHPARSFVGSRRLGISTGFEDICASCSRALLSRERASLGRPWRLPLLGGLVIGGFLSAVLGGGWSRPGRSACSIRRSDSGPAGKLAWMFVGGLFIGFGTRLAGGCTSGHGIFGLSNLELPSLITTISFMAAGIVTTQLVYRVIFR